MALVGSQRYIAVKGWRNRSNSFANLSPYHTLLWVLPIIAIPSAKHQILFSLAASFHDRIICVIRGLQLYRSYWFVPGSTRVSSALFMSQEKRAHRLVASYCLTFNSFHLRAPREAAALTPAGPFGGNLVQSRKPTSCPWLTLFWLQNIHFHCHSECFFFHPDH